jgi:hypothetical protein
MIVQPRGDRLLLIRQTDHAALSGMLAEHWGNETFAALDPHESLLIAAGHHDDGWRLWEAAPRVDPATRRPYQFTDLPLAEHLAFYQHGIDTVRARDGYAGLLVCMHLAGLYRMRLGTDSPFGLRPLPPDEERDLRGILDRLGDQQRQMREQLSAAGVAARLLQDPVLGINFRLLQVFDRLSLYFCTAPPAERQIAAVPTDYAGHPVPLSLRPVDERTVEVSPFPFRSSPLEVAVRASTVTNRPYAGDEDFRAAFAAAPTLELRFEVREG